MATTTKINPEKLIDGHFVDLDTLLGHIDYLALHGISHIILATAIWRNNQGNPVFGSRDGEAQYGYMLRTIGGFNRLEVADNYRWLHCDDQLTKEGVHSTGSINDIDFATGAVARVVTDPVEIEGVAFSYDSHAAKAEAAKQQMPVVAEIQQTT